MRVHCSPRAAAEATLRPSRTLGGHPKPASMPRWSYFAVITQGSTSSGTDAIERRLRLDVTLLSS